MQFTGIIKKILPKQTRASGSEKQDVIVSDWEKYPNEIKVEFSKFKDKDYIKMLDWLKEWSKVELELNFKTKERNDKRFTSISCRKLTKIQTVSDKMTERSDRVEWVRQMKSEDSFLPF